MNAVTLEYPGSWLAALGVDEKRFEQDAKMAAAVKLYEVGRFSSGQAAQLAGLGRAEFLLGCREWGVDTVRWNDADLEAEFSTPLPVRS